MDNNYSKQIREYLNIIIFINENISLNKSQLLECFQILILLSSKEQKNNDNSN